MEMTLTLQIKNDNAYEEDEEFYIELYEPYSDPPEEGKVQVLAELGEIPKATMIHDRFKSWNDYPVIFAGFTTFTMFKQFTSFPSDRLHPKFLLAVSCGDLSHAGV